MIKLGLWLKYMIKFEMQEGNLQMLEEFYQEKQLIVKDIYLNIFSKLKIWSTDVCRGGATGLASGEVSSPVAGRKIINWGLKDCNC